MGILKEPVAGDVFPCLQCAFCQSLPQLNNWRQCKECEALFCESCISQQRKMTEITCPSCSSNCHIADCKQSRIVNDLLAKVQMKCNFSTEGCPKVIPFSNNYEAHIPDGDCQLARQSPSCDNCNNLTNKINSLTEQVTEIWSEVRDLNASNSRIINKLQRKMDSLLVGLFAQKQKEISEISAFTKAIRDLENSIQPYLQEGRRTNPSKLQLKVMTFPLDSENTTVKKETDDLSMSNRIKSALIEVSIENFLPNQSLHQKRFVEWTSKLCQVVLPHLKEEARILLFGDYAWFGYPSCVLSALAGQEAVVFDQEPCSERVESVTRNIENSNPELIANKQLFMVQHSRMDVPYRPDGMYDVIVQHWIHAEGWHPDHYLPFLQPGGIMVYRESATTRKYKAFVKTVDNDLEKVFCDLSY